MTRTWTALAWFAGLLALSVVGVTVYFAFFFDANVYKPRIVAAAKHYTDRPLTIDGDVSVELLPSPHATRYGVCALMIRSDPAAHHWPKWKR